MKFLLKHFQSTRTAKQANQIKSGDSFQSKKIALLGLLTAVQTMGASIAIAAPVQLTLDQTFVGKYGYKVTGATRRTQSNTVNACSVLSPTTSNTASLSLPTGTTVVKAFLYWTGSTNLQANSDWNVTFEGQSISAPVNRRYYLNYASDTTEGYFNGRVDVTSIVQNKGSGTYSFSDLTVNTGTPHCSVKTVLAGWELIVIYQDNSLPNTAVNLYDGFVDGQNTSFNFTLDKLAVTNNPIASMTTTIWEGDSDLSNNEALRYDGGLGVSTLANGPFDSNSTALGNNNTYGFDADTYNVSTLTQAGVTQVTGTVQTGQDYVFLNNVIIAATTQVADLKIEKTVDNATPSVGQTITFTVNVTNEGPDTTNNVTVKDLLPTEISHISNTGGGSYNPTTGIWNVGTLTNGQSKSLQITAQVNNTGNITNIAEVTGSSLRDPDSQINNNISTEDDQASVTVTATNTTSISGTLYQDTNNNDTLNLGETTLPANITVKLLDSTGTTILKTTTTNASGQYTFTGVANGTYKIQVDTTDTDIPTSLTLGTSNNLAVTVSGSPITGQNFGFDLTATAVAYKSAKLTNDADSSGSLTPGDTVTWSVTYINTSTVDIPNFQVTDALSSGVTIAGTPTVIATGVGQLTPSINNGFNGSTTTSLFTSPVLLKAGGILKVDIPTLLNAGTANTIQSNQAKGIGTNLPAAGIFTDNIDNTTINLPVGVTVSLGSINQTQTSNIDPTTINVATAPVVSGYKSVKLTNDADISTTVTPGDGLTWTVTYTNTGTVDIPNFQVTDALPSGMTIAGTATITALGVGQTTPTYNSSYNGTGNNTLFNSGVTLKAGGTIAINIPVTVNTGSTGTKANQATATGSNLPASGIKTDNIDNTTIGLPGGITVAPGSLSQTQTATIDATSVIVNTPVTGLALGFKSVKLTQDLDVSGGPTPGDILNWTISYTNTGTVDIKNFQITDSLATGLSAGGTPIISATGLAQVTPIANSAYDGVGNNALFNTAIDLKAGSTVSVNLPVKIDANVAVTTLTNQAVGSGTNLPAVNTDNIDNATTSLPVGITVPSGSIAQTQNPSIDPTSLQISFIVFGTLYQDSDGGDDLDATEPKLPANITVKLLDSTGTIILKTTTTNASGQYTFTGITNGNYKIQVDTTDTDIPTGFTLGTPNNLAITVSGSSVTGKNFGFDVAAGFCNLGGGTNDPTIQPYISTEVGNTSVAGSIPTNLRSLTDQLDDTWRTAAGGSTTGTVEPWFGNNSAPGSATNFTYREPNSNTAIATTVESVQVSFITPATCNGGNAAASGFALAFSDSLQDSSPRPTSLYNSADQPGFWNHTGGSNDSKRNAVRFTFAQPVKSFGAWFGDLETRTQGGGAPAYLRLLDASGNRIGQDIAITPQTLDNGTSSTPNPQPLNQANCSTSAASQLGCGNKTSRWVGFVDNNASPRIKQVLVIVGDDDDTGNGDTERLSFIGFNTIPIASNPNLLLVKRITAINGVPLNQFVDDPNSTNDNNPKWPTPANTYLRGVIDGGVVQPGDELEYTIYFLSNGDGNATNVTICDLVPENTTFIPTAFNSLTPIDGSLPGADLGIGLALNSTSLPTTPTVYLSNVADADRGEFFAAGKKPPVACSGSNSNGAVIVTVVKKPNTLPHATGSGTPTNSYGFIRFRARVK